MVLLDILQAVTKWLAGKTKKKKKCPKVYSGTFAFTVKVTVETLQNI